MYKSWNTSPVEICILHGPDCLGCCCPYGKTDDLTVDVIHLVVDADMIRCFVVFVFYFSVEITFSKPFSLCLFFLPFLLNWPDHFEISNSQVAPTKQINFLSLNSCPS